MLLTLQFPFADSRKFISNAGVLDLPGWPLPTPNQEFIRYFGCIRVRGGEGMIESEVCEANKAVRFVKNPSSVFEQSRNREKAGPTYRYFHFDGLAVGKLEVSIGTRSPKITLQKNDLDSLITNFLMLPVRIPHPLNKPKIYQLAQANKPLAKLYTLASTDYTDANRRHLEDWWVSTGSPLLFLEYRDIAKDPSPLTELSLREKIDIPYQLKQVQLGNTDDFELYHCLVPYSGGRIPMWVLKTRAIKPFPLGNTIRLHLTRRHAEHECLRLILSHILSGKIDIQPRSIESNDLQHYLNRTIKRIRRIESSVYHYYEPAIGKIGALIHQSAFLISPGQYTALLAQLERIDIRRNILRNVQDYSRMWKNESVSQVDLPKIRQQIEEFFDENELRTLCFDLSVDYQSLEAIGKAGKARELVQFMKRNNRLVDLLMMCRKLRPNANW